jgi:hypothetical protein
MRFVSEVRRHPSKTQIYTIATHRYALFNQQRALPPSLGEAPVGADHAMPREVIVDRGKNASDEARGDRVDVAIRADETNGDRAHPRDDAIVAGLIHSLLHSVVWLLTPDSFDRECD